MAFFEETGLAAELVTLFSRLRVAENSTQNSITQNTPTRVIFNAEGQVSGSGTLAFYSAQEAVTLLAVGETIGLRRLRNRVAGLYIPGNALLCLFTFNFNNDNKANVIKRVGYYDDSDGIFLQQYNGDTLAWVRRHSTTGTVLEEVVDQSNWGDPNESADTNNFTENDGVAYAFDNTKCHIGFITLEWLGVGDVVCGFVNNGVPIPSHIFRHPNVLAQPYIRTANLFLSYEIERTADDVGAGFDSIKTICATLQTEGTDNKSGAIQVVRMLQPFTTDSRDEFNALLLFRLNPSFINSRVLITGFKVVLTNNADTFYEAYIVAAPVFQNAYTPVWTDVPNSALQVDNTISDSDDPVVSSFGYITQGTIASNDRNVPSTQESTGSRQNLEFIGSEADGTPNVWALVIQASQNSVTIEYATVDFWEQK